MEKVRPSKSKLGSTAKKVLLLLEGGLALSLTKRPDVYFRIIGRIAKEWQDINREVLYKAIRRLYQSQLIDYKEKEDGTIDLTLTKDGKNKILRYNLDKLTLKRPTKWDKLWRLVIFDIPEDFKNARDAFTSKLTEVGFYPLQKSVFIYPYDCKDEVDFLIEVFGLRPFVRFIVVKEIDIALHLKTKFKLH